MMPSVRKADERVAVAERFTGIDDNGTFGTDRCDRLTGTRLNHADDLRVKVVSFEEQPFGFANGRQAFFVFIVVDRRADDFFGRLDIVEGNGDDGVCGKCAGDFGITRIKGQAFAEDGVGQFFGPVTGGDVIFDGKVVAVRIKRVDFPFDRFDAAPVPVQLGKFLGERRRKNKAVVMARLRHHFRTADG